MSFAEMSPVDLGRAQVHTANGDEPMTLTTQAVGGAVVVAADELSQTLVDTRQSPSDDAGTAR